ncbi:hypothetical protein EON65_50320 [archaeon]|nr:MAG: hypothetical protein EON65_50320 [archaeon]
MVDYSKWDRFDAGSSDEEDIRDPIPKVTTLSNQSKITIGPKGYTVSESEEGEAITRKEKSILSSGERTRNGSMVVKKNFSFTWSQDRYTTSLYISIAKHLKEKKLSVTLQDKELKVLVPADSTVLLQGRLQYDVELTGEADNPWDKICDWEILQEKGDRDHNTLRISFTKKTPIPGTVLWWSRVFSDDDPIDVTQLQDRRQQDLTANKNFFEATEMFKEKARNWSKIEVEDEKDSEGEA